MASSAEQKALNKEAQRKRSRAFRARQDEFITEKARRLELFHGSTTFKAERDAAAAAEDAAREAASAVEAEIWAKIAALQAELENVRALHGKKVEELTVARRRTNTAYQAAKAAIEDEVDAQFKDVVGVWSAAAWAGPAKDS